MCCYTATHPTKRENMQTKYEFLGRQIATFYNLKATSSNLRFLTIFQKLTKLKQNKTKKLMIAFQGKQKL